MKPPHRIALSAAVALLVLVIVPAALAGKGGKGNAASNDPSLSLVMVNDVNGNGLPNYGDAVTFSVVTSASYPNVQLLCWQNGALVFDQTAGFYQTYAASTEYALVDDRWAGGAADCTATLYTTSSNGKQTTQATTSFHVDA